MSKSKGKKIEGVLRARPEGIRYCGKCGQMAECGRGQSACKECRAAAARAARAEFNHGVEALSRVLGE